MRKIKVAIDGPAGAGKSTISKVVAKRLDYLHIDTGAIYRSIAYNCILNSVNENDVEKIIDIAKNTNINLDLDKKNKNIIIYLNGENISEQIRESRVSNFVPYVAKITEVRNYLLKIQRDLAYNNDGIVMDGRDIGTVILKDADLKIFLTATVEERAKRRYKELLERGEKVDLQVIMQEIEQRDNFDRTREVGPLIQASDAYLLDTTYKSAEEVISEIIHLVETKSKEIVVY